MKHLEDLQEYNQKLKAEITEDMLVPKYKQGSEGNLHNMLDTMQRIVTKLKIEPRHHDCKPVDSMG